MNKKTVIDKVQNKLFEMQDLKYRDFHAKLIPTMDKEKIIGCLLYTSDAADEL